MGSKQEDPEKSIYSMLHVRKNHAKSFTERQKGVLGIVDEELRQGLVSHMVNNVYLAGKKKSMP